ncbi:hypothetical protein ColTof4_00903 [Colletotrichum tofieldiae]|nr:hypothetical protein ColTof3_08123 [Colletotrichum tofieldiae]GKT68480.1 hypothetical protein ColTof4_00903 [Colletotrichum tofieldiae]
MTNKTPAKTDSPVVTGAFTDGASLLDPLEPRLSFINLRVKCYFGNNGGFVVQTDIKTITMDITASALATLQAAYSTFNFFTNAIKDLPDMVINPGPTDKKPDEDSSGPQEHPVQPGSIRDIGSDNFLAGLKKPPKAIKVREVDQKDATAGQTSKALFSRKQVTRMVTDELL